jgi:hypothetical protein
VNIRPGLRHWLQVKCKSGRQILWQPHWPNISYLMQFAGNQEASQWHDQVVTQPVTWLVHFYCQGNELSNINGPRSCSCDSWGVVQPCCAESMPHRQTPRPSMIRFKNIQMLVVHCYSSLGPDVRRLYPAHSKRVVCCNRNISRNYEYVIQIWSLIACYIENVQAVFSKQNYPQQPGRKPTSFNYIFLGAPYKVNLHQVESKSAVVAM